MGLFHNVHEQGEDQIFGLQRHFQEDSRENKVNLSIGVYIEEGGKAPKVLSSVKKAEELALKEERSKTYLPIEGDHKFIEATGKLLFGDHYGEKICGAQTVGGTGALHILLDFCKKEISNLSCISYPTWPNHIEILRSLDFQVDQHPYGLTYVEFDRIMSHVGNLLERTILILQPMSHNPTGCDLTMEQWKQLSELCHQKKLFPFFDCAYQGFGKGLKEDVAPIHLFIEQGHEVFVAYSFSKSMALYNERVGAAFVVVNEEGERSRVQNALKKIIRTDYSNPPQHGAYIARKILDTPDLRSIWESEMNAMRVRVQKLRKDFSARMCKKFGNDDYRYLENGQGFFSVIELSKEQIEHLKNEYGVYITRSGRVNLAGLNEVNMDYVVDSIHSL